MWLAYTCTVSGLAAAALYFRAGLIQGALCGLAVGMALVLLANVIAETPAPCLQNSKGWQIFLAYKFCV